MQLSISTLFVEKAAASFFDYSGTPGDAFVNAYRTRQDGENPAGSGDYSRVICYLAFTDERTVR